MIGGEEVAFVCGLDLSVEFRVLIYWMRYSFSREAVVCALGHDLLA
jgi:hypothetical protein